MAVDTTPTVDVRARLRQVPVQELVLPVVIIALVIVGVIIRPGVFLTPVIHDGLECRSLLILA
jgi:hypothetical protein